MGVVTSGAETLEVGGEKLIAASGTCLLLNAEQAHANASIAPEPLSYRVFYIPPEVISQWSPLKLSFGRPICVSEDLFRRVSETHVLLERSQDRLEQELAFAALMRSLACTTSTQVVEPRDALCGPRVRRVIEYIDEFYAEAIGLHELCEVAELSRFNLIRVFKRATGLSPLAYRNQRRIDAARAMLRSNRSITQIASELGFADHAHLTRHFQRLVGTTPSNYRMQ